MKVGISFDDRVKRRYFGETKYPPKDYFKIDMALPDYVENALELTKPVWGRYSEVPICRMYDGLEDLELVFMSGYGDHNEKPDFTRNELITKISIGAENKNHNEMRNPLELNYEKPTRLSIGLYAGRKFFPIKWAKLPKSYDSHSGKDNRRSKYIFEEVNIGEEWIDDGLGHYGSDQLGEWSNIKTWTQKGSYDSVLRPRFNDEKTTFYSVTLNELRRESSTEREKNMRLVYDFIKKERRRDRRFVLNTDLSVLDIKNKEFQFDSPIGELVKPFLECIDTRGIPLIGYGRVRRVLPNLPNPKIMGVNGMNRKEGVEFFFKDLLPKMQEWAESKK